ncbi:MAG: hypothetical protein F6K21_05130 [Symploca sp. SIO2D2]|nr:hypothetical protein [Symploca sp. SIO2D2]
MNNNPKNNFSENSDENLIDYLKELQKESWYDLTSTFREPLSSILPLKRNIESELIFDDIEIEAHYDRFSSWEGTISKKSIRDWLEQFETIFDKNIAHLLLKKFQFVSKSDIEIASRALQNKLLDLLIEEESLIEIFNSVSNPSKKSDDNFRKWLQNKVIRYARFPSPSNTSVESQDRLWGIYERSALTGTSSPDGKKLRPLKEYFEAESSNPENSVFVFMDYTNGSGNQLSKCVIEINKLLAKYPVYTNSIFVFMYIVQSEFFLLDNMEFAAPNSQTIFYNNMLYYKSSEIINLLANYQINEEEYGAFIEKYCLRSSGKTEAGYEQSGSLTCHHYSCPNNTLTFFHKPYENWTPLFRNSQTPSATNYKRK